MPFSDLPNELAEKITVHLKGDEYSLRALCLTSHTWRAIASSQLFSRMLFFDGNVLQRYFVISRTCFDNILASAVREVISYRQISSARILDECKSLPIFNAHTWVRSGVSSPRLPIFPGVKSLCIECFMPSILDHLFRMSSITTLTLQGAFPGYRAMAAIFKDTIALRYLDMSLVYIQKEEDSQIIGTPLSAEVSIATSSTRPSTPAPLSLLTTVIYPAAGSLADPITTDIIAARSPALRAVDIRCSAEQVFGLQMVEKMLRVLSGSLECLTVTFDTSGTCYNKLLSLRWFG